MPDPKNITETTTLAELREQRLLLGVIALHLYLDPFANGSVAVSVSHKTGIYEGTGSTEAMAIEDAFVKLRHALLPEPIKQYLRDIEEKKS